MSEMTREQMNEHWYSWQERVLSAEAERDALKRENAELRDVRAETIGGIINRVERENDRLARENESLERALERSQTAEADVLHLARELTAAKQQLAQEFERGVRAAEKIVRSAEYAALTSELPGVMGTETRPVRYRDDIADAILALLPPQADR